MSTVDYTPADAPRRFRSEKPVAVLGGGPAGLTAGYLLAKEGRPVIVFEAEDQVGGIAKTEVRDGYRFDLGGHRFFTKSKEVDDLWHEVMKEEFLRRPRMSRIYWNGKFLDYPLNGSDVIKKLGPIELTRCLLSYLWAAVKPKGREDNLEQWVSNRFGKRLFQHFSILACTVIFAHTIDAKSLGVYLFMGLLNPAKPVGHPIEASIVRIR